MNYEEFKENILQAVKEKLGEDYSVRIFSVRKNNGLLLDNLSIQKKGAMVSPCIYLEYVYERFRDGLAMEDAADQIIAYYHASMPKHFDPESYFNAESIRSHLFCRLVNTERNKKLLDECPHLQFLNLSVLFYLMFDDPEVGAGSIVLRSEHLAGMGLREEELLPLALENMRRLLPADFMTMDQMIRELKDEETPGTGEEESHNVPLYILTNSRRTFGAVWMADSETLGRIAVKLNDDFYVLPSSVHECMVLPASLKDDVSSLTRMVEEINETQVAPEEILADTIYRYSRDSRKLEIAA